MKSTLPLRHWTEAEDACLRERYATGDIVALAASLDRTIESLRKRAQALKLQTWRYWTEADLARVRESWGKVKTRALAAELGRTPNAVKQQATKMGLDAGRRYSAEELQLIRELYPTRSAAEIAERIFGTGQAALAIFRMAYKLGLEKFPHWGPEVLERVRQLHAEGLTDADIARRMPDVFTGDDPRSQAMHVRRVRLKLSANAEAVKEAGRRAVKKQFATLGISSGGELRALSYRKYAAANGWPEDCRPREVQILNVLAARGVPMSKREIAEAIGMPTDTTFRSGKRRILLAGNGPGGTYTASLLRRGLLCRLARAGVVSGRGKGRSVDLYVLGPAALSLLEARACQNNATPSDSAKLGS